MSMYEQIYITKEGLKKLKEDLKHLKTVKRVEMSERLQRAIKEGDLRENAEYSDAKLEQSFVEGRIRELEDSLRRVKIIEDKGPSNTVRIGSTVTVIEAEFDDEETYRIVGIHEADPSKGMISNVSPLGSALLGAKVGKSVVVSTPVGDTRFKVKAIS